jgi:hypothetical protein
MSAILPFSTEELMPDRDAVLANQGIPAGKAVSREIDGLYVRALELVVEFAAPAGILGEISQADFEAVYRGEGRNEPSTPVGDIFPKAENLALFAVTLGPRISREITEHFGSSEFARGAMLDAAASAATDKLAEVSASRFADILAREGRATTDTAVLGYSPGYCGWHISGQRKLFEFLRPERIGILLTDSFLMQPLKSVSGVLIAGPKAIHDFQMTYACCTQCEPRGCRERIRALLAQ